MPTALPMANGLLDVLWQSLNDRIKNTWEITPRIKNPNSWPQFELVIEEVRQVRPDVAKDLLSCYAKVSPNENHRLLAELGIMGCSLITTNFDTNVEAAIEKYGGKPCALAAVKDCIGYKRYQKEVPILKLHGCIKRPQTIVSTTSALTRRGIQGDYYSLSRPRKRLLSRILDSRVCFALGYSGSDRFDIDPVLRQRKNTKIVVVRHDLEPTPLAPLEIMCRIDGFTRVRDRWYDDDIHTDTTDFLVNLSRLCGIDVESPEIPLPVGPPDIKNIQRLCDKLRPNEALVILMRILDDVGQHESVKDLLNSGLIHHVPANVKYQLQINHIRFNYEGLQEVRKLDELKRDIQPQIDREIVAQISYFRAYALDSALKYVESLEESEQAIALAEKSGKRYQLLQARAFRCLLLGRLGRMDEAVSEFRSLYKPMKASGMSANLAEVCSNIGTLLAQNNELDEAEEMMERAVNLWKIAGQPQERQQAELNQVNLLFHKEKNKEGRSKLNSLLKETRKSDVRAHALLLSGHDHCGRLSAWKKGLSELASCFELMLLLESDQHLLNEACEIAVECLREYKNINAPLSRSRRADKEAGNLKKMLEKAKSVIEIVLK